MAVNSATDYIRERLKDYQKDTIQINTAENTSEDVEYVMMFNDVQKYVVREKLPELTASIAKNDTSVLANVISIYIAKEYKQYAINDDVLKKTVDRCVSDMTGYAFLNELFAKRDELEEININGWDQVLVKWVDGRKEIYPKHFYSAEHARDIMTRILRQTGKYLDEQKIYEISYIGKDVRIAVVITPIADKEIGVAASIRFIHPAVYTLEKLEEIGTLTPEMGNMLQSFINYGISICVCGTTGSGKTTVCNALLENVPPMKRVITLEGGTREYELVRRDDKGNLLNDRLHMQTRPHRDGALNVDLQTLLDLVLKFDPDIIGVGEMVSEEAFIASEAANTGHPVITTIHSTNAFEAYYRMFTLGMRKYELNENLMMKLMVDAFPIIVFTKQYPDGKRRVQSILEGEFDTANNKIRYNELYHYEVADNERAEDGNIHTIGSHKQKGEISGRLVSLMLDNGATRAEIEDLKIKD